MAEKEAPHSINRNGFVKVILTFIGTIMGAVIGLPAVGYLISPALKTQKTESWISLGALEDYPLGVPVPFSFTRTTVNGWEKTVNSYGVFILRKEDGSVRVLSNRCTHLSCRVTWKEQQHDFLCPCHDGHFDIDGQVVAGPPPAPLQEFETKIEDGSLFFFFQGG